MTADPSCIVVLTTLPNAREAHTLVRDLVERRLVACGTVLGAARSVYRWQGRVEEADEAQVLLKTRRDRWPTLQAAVQDAHPNSVPELLAIGVEEGLPSYLEWVSTESSPAESQA